MKLQIPYNDLRSWLGLAGEVGEVRAVDGASWQEEIGMAAELLNHSDPAPAVRTFGLRLRPVEQALREALTPSREKA